MVWYGMVWYGMVWYGMVWYGMVWYGCGKYGVMNTNIRYLCFREVEALECFKLEGIRYGDTNAATERV